MVGDGPTCLPGVTASGEWTLRYAGVADASPKGDGWSGFRLIHLMYASYGRFHDVNLENGSCEYALRRLGRFAA